MPSRTLATPGRLAPRRLVQVAVAGLLLATIAACSPAPSSPPATTGATPNPANSTGPIASGSPGTSPSSADAAAVYGAIARQVEALRGLEPKADVQPVLLDADQLRANLTAEFDRENPATSIQMTEALYRELGLLPAGASLRQAYLDLQSGQVIGYYSPNDKQLFLVSRSGGIGPTQRMTYAHEFTHQLQDQNFDLSKLGLDAAGESDRALGRLAVVEGDAVSAQTAWMSANLSPSDLAQVLADASDPAALAALQHAPPILRTLSLFPYTDGLNFVSRLKAQGSQAAVDAAFTNPPASTAQILHPDLYLAHVAPVSVTLPNSLASALGAGWTLLGEDTLGEEMIRAWLTADGVDAATASTAAAGWIGDRVAILKGSNGQLAMVLLTRWANPADMKEFSDAVGVLRTKGQGGLYDGALGDNLAGLVIAPSPAGEQALDNALRP
jgi:hypothetical protein